MRAAAPGFRDPPGHSVQPGGRVEGIDPSPPMIDYAAGRGSVHCVFTVAAAEALPFEDAAFDVVTSTLVIHHITPGNQATRQPGDRAGRDGAGAAPGRASAGRRLPAPG